PAAAGGVGEGRAEEEVVHGEDGRVEGERGGERVHGGADEAGVPTTERAGERHRLGVEPAPFEVEGEGDARALGAGVAGERGHVEAVERAVEGVGRHVVERPAGEAEAGGAALEIEERLGLGIALAEVERDGARVELRAVDARRLEDDAAARGRGLEVEAGGVELDPAVEAGLEGGVVEDQGEVDAPEGGLGEAERGLLVERAAGDGEGERALWRGGVHAQVERAATERADGRAAGDLLLAVARALEDRKSTRLNSSHVKI